MCVRGTERICHPVQQCGSLMCGNYLIIKKNLTKVVLLVKFFFFLVFVVARINLQIHKCKKNKSQSAGSSKERASVERRGTHKEEPQHVEQPQRQVGHKVDGSRGKNKTGVKGGN